MNLQKLLMLALLAAAVSATTAPTLGKILGFGGHTVAFAQDEDPGDQGEDNDDQ